MKIGKKSMCRGKVIKEPIEQSQTLQKSDNLNKF